MKTNSIKAWFLAARPKTLTGAVAPVIVGGALAWCDTFGRTLASSRRLFEVGHDSNVYLTSHFISYIVPFVLCLLFAMVMQIDANFVNDWWDARKGTDREDRLGPERACAQGWITSRAMVIGIVITTLLACAIGMLLMLWHLQWELLIVGVLCVLGCFLYTLKLSYIGMGDLLVVLFFGIVPVGFTYYVITNGLWTMPVTLAGLGMGLATDNLLMVNNYRDVEQDRISGKRTLVVRYGKEFGLQAYLWLGVVGMMFAIASIMCVGNRGVLMVLYLVLHIVTFMKMRKLTGKALNAVLGSTARNIFIYGLLMALSLMLGGH